MPVRGVSPCTSRELSFRSLSPLDTTFATAKPSIHKRNDSGALKVVAGNANADGLFSPLVVFTRDIVGKKRFNKFRGKAIQLHSQVREAKR